MKNIDFLKTALQDPEVKGLVFLSPRHRNKLERLLRTHPEDFYLSEWEYKIGGIEFKYHMHNPEKGKEIKRLYDVGEQGGNPHLFGLYSRTDLEEKLKSYKIREFFFFHG